MGECVGEEGGGRRYEYVFHPSISLHRSANRSQRAFVSALLLPFFPYPPEQADAFSRCQHSFYVYLCVCVSVFVCKMAYIYGIGLVAVWTFSNCNIL